MVRPVAFIISCLVCHFSSGAGLAAGTFADCVVEKVENLATTFVVSGRDYTLKIEDFEADSRVFNLRASPAEGLAESDAMRAVALQSDLICMHLDGSPMKTGSGSLVGGAWVFAGGCTGHLVRMEDKC